MEDNKRPPSGDGLWDDVLLNHNYDGIEEFDNPMPGWWTGLFGLTVIWAGFYLVAINVGAINTYEDDLAQGMAELESVRGKHQAAQPKITIDDAMIIAAVDKPEALEEGKTQFTEKCAPCHGAEGQGLIGPNLTDDHWLHGGELTKVFASIKTGIPDKGMPPWGGMLRDEQIVNVTAYIRTLRGTNPKGAKEPQGEIYSPPANEGDKEDAPAKEEAPKETDAKTNP